VVKRLRRVADAPLPVPTVPTRPLVTPALRDLARAQPIELVISGHCMQPGIGPGSRVQVRARRAYWPGDILVFEAVDGRLLAHRLVGYRWWPVRGLRLVTCADAAARGDAPIEPRRVIGRVCGGEVDTAVSAIPLAERLRALARFATLSATAASRRLRGGAS
jgi:hypothetical protein